MHRGLWFSSLWLATPRPWLPKLREKMVPGVLKAIRKRKQELGVEMVRVKIDPATNKKTV